MNDYRPFEWNDILKEWKRANDWYQYLNFTPEMVISKCLSAGVDISDALDILEVWGHDMLEITKRVREPQPSEIPSVEVYKKDIDPNETFRSVYEYDRTVEKPAFENSIAKCEIIGDPRAKEETLCRNLLCQPDTIEPITGRTLRNRIDKDADVEHVFADNKEKIIKYKRCFSKGIKTCQKIQKSSFQGHDISDTYDPEKFTYFQTTGDGNCLFWAISRYVNIATTLKKWPQLENIDDIPDKSVACTATNIAQVKKLRADAMEWLAANINSNYDILGRTIGEELASDIIRQVKFNSLKLTVEQLKTLELRTTNDHDHGEHIINNSRNASCTQCRGLNFSTDEFKSARTDFIADLATKYITRMRKDGTYGGQHEIYALSKILNANIIVMQSLNDTYLTSNMGIKGKSEKNIYIVHTLDIGRDIGGLHYETLFALPYTKFVCILQGYEINNLAIEMHSIGEEMPFYTVANRNIYNEIIGAYISTITQPTPVIIDIIEKHREQAKHISTRSIITELLRYLKQLPQVISINETLKTMIRMYNNAVPDDNKTITYDEPTGAAALNNLSIVVQLLEYITSYIPDAKAIGNKVLTDVFVHNKQTLHDSYGIDFDETKPTTLVKLFEILNAIAGDGNFMI